MPYKKERMEKQIERELGSIILNDVKDDRIKFVTVTNVNLTNDLSIATIFYTVFGNSDQIENSSRVLNEAKGFIRSLLAKKIQVKKVPDLIFKYDTSYENGKRIEEVLKNIKYFTEEDSEKEEQ